MRSYPSTSDISFALSQFKQFAIRDCCQNAWSVLKQQYCLGLRMHFSQDFPLNIVCCRKHGRGFPLLVTDLHVELGTCWNRCRENSSQSWCPWLAILPLGRGPSLSAEKQRRHATSALTQVWYVGCIPKEDWGQFCLPDSHIDRRWCCGCRTLAWLTQHDVTFVGFLCKVSHFYNSIILSRCE